MRGRAAEQKIIRDLLRCAQGGTGGVVLVKGEPGIGTSLLLRDATEEAAELGFSLEWEPRTSWARRSRCTRCARPCEISSPAPVLTITMRAGPAVCMPCTPVLSGAVWLGLLCAGQGLTAV